MSRPLPKRDLELLESDSEDTDFKTPIKVKRATKMMPQRELPVLDSESEDEPDSLNCAINLNDSFIFTPSKGVDTPEVDPAIKSVEINVVPQQSVAEPSTSKSSIFTFKIAQENDKNLLNSHRNPGKGLDDQLANLRLKDDVKLSVNTAVGRPPAGIPRKDDHLDIIKYRPINQKRVQPPAAVPVPQWRTSSTDSGISSPIRLKEVVRTAEDACSDSTKPPPAKEPVFVTPGYHKLMKPATSVRSRLNRLPLGLSCRKPTEQPEFDNQKVLFTTPIGVSCKPVASIANSSVSLSLDDSVQVEPLLLKTPAATTSYRDTHHLATVDEANTTEPRQDVRRIKNQDYVIEKKIGYGGSSTVYLARRLDTGQELALKVVDLQGDVVIVQGYLNETKLLVSLQGNPNIITLYDYYHSEQESLLYMVMEKGDTDLHKVLQMYKTDIPLYKLIRHWYEMLLAVDFIHQRGVIHSDLKPANFLMVNGHLKLIDFGIASNINLDATSIVKNCQAGTFNYISPEAVTDTSEDNSSQVPKIKISTKSDVWSLGCILYLLIYKRTPFAHIKNPMYKVAAIADAKTEIQYAELPIYYPSFLLKMLKACLRHNPKERASVQDLLKFPFHMIIPIQPQ